MKSNFLSRLKGQAFRVAVITIFTLILTISSIKVLMTLFYDRLDSIASHISFNLTGGMTIDELEFEGLLPKTIDAYFSEQAYVILLDQGGNLILNTGVFGENLPAIPSSLLTKSDWEIKHKLWRQDPEIPQAISVASYTVQESGDQGYVIVGRSLLNTLRYITDILSFHAVVWILLITIFVITPSFLSQKHR